MTQGLEKDNLLYVRRLAFFCLAVHFIFSMVGWGHSLLDHHGNRQTNTAIPAYYFLKEGFTLDYQTPVLGVPWSVPLEFPLYQGMVAFVVKLTGWPLDQTGRGVSLFFFYAMLVVLFRILTRLSLSKVPGWLAVAFCLASPIYLYWSKTFLQETMVLFCSILYIGGIVESHQDRRLFWVILAMTAGCLAAAAKITTFLLAITLGCMLCLIWWFKQGDKKFSPQILSKAGVMAVAYGLVPAVSALLWTSFADSLKLKNALAASLASKMFLGWLFGSLHQRLFGQLHHIPVLVLFMGLMALFTFFLSIVRGVQSYFAAFFTAFLLGPMVFANLYIAHTYYWCECAVYFYAALGLVASAMLAKPWAAPYLKKFVIPFFIILMVGITALRYLPGQVYDSAAYFVADAKSIQQYVPSGGVMLIYGLGIDPSFAYYAERKAVMVGNLPVSNPAVAQSIELTGRDKIRALVIGPENMQREDYLRQVARQFHLDREIYLTVGKGIITQYDLETYSYDWDDVSAKLVKNGWATRINPVELRLKEGFESDKERMAVVFGADFEGLYHHIEEAHDFHCFVR